MRMQAGVREGKREQGQPGTTTTGKQGKHNKGREQAREHTTSRQEEASEKERRMEGGESTRNPTLAGRRGKAQSRLHP